MCVLSYAFHTGMMWYRAEWNRNLKIAICQKQFIYPLPFIHIKLYYIVIITICKGIKLKYLINDL